MKIDPKIKFLASVGLLLAILAFSFWLSEMAADNSYVQQIIFRYGYIGTFIAAVISGFNLLIPIPAVSFMPALLESGLNYYICVFLLALGMTVADTAAYILGRAGRGIFSENLHNQVAKRLDRLKEKHPIYPLAAVFIFASIMPFPNEVLLVPLGFFRYRIAYLLGAIFLGNILFNLLYSKGFVYVFSILN
jgi:membrane protein YqaA with SNARE-associated domain